MAAEGEGQNKGDIVFIPTTAEDQFDGPKRYVSLAAPWYTDLKTILMFAYLSTVLLGGCIILIALVFTKNPWEIFVITFGFLALALIGIFVKIHLEKLNTRTK